LCLLADIKTRNSITKFVKNKFKVVKKRLKTLKKKKFLQNLFYDLMILSLSLSKLQQKSMKGFYHISSSGLWNSASPFAPC